MIKQIRKETLTNEHIKHDLLEYEKEQHENHSYRLYPILFPIALLGFLLALFFRNFWILIPTVAIYLTVDIIDQCLQKCDSKKRKQQIQNGAFSVTKETLVNIGEETIYEPHASRSRRLVGGRSYLTRTVTFFYFSHSRWRMPRGKCYSWSKLYHMSTNGLMNTSVLGNEFYLVTTNEDHEVAYVYNAKLFEYKE